MNKGKLKSYAPKARLEFIEAVTDRAHFYGLSKDKQEPVKVEGDFAIITGRAFPKAVADQRKKLEDRIAASSFNHVMDEIAYTWFNRFVAIRYMELHGYLSHGYRVLSNPEQDNAIPEILEKAQHVDLQGLDKNKVIELKMDGNKDEELYRELLIAQCNELNRAMPFLFESIKDCTELLLPDNLLHSDSLIRKLVNEIEQQDWQEVEIIGWMYQFYISEKKDEVIGKVVKSEDIPAATQLFTPNWIVKYLVQNSLGAQWMRTYPDSALKSKMEYYIESAEQSEDVQKQLAEITPDSLNPEELTLLDPACGSGHILVEGYDVLREIYLERGYRKRDVAELILKNNLFGLEIDDRAAQLSGFALMMKARADDRRIFERQAQPNIVSIQETKELDVKEIVRAINAPLTEKDVEDSTTSDEFGFMEEVRTPLFASKSKQSFSEEEKLTVNDLKALLGLFEHGKTFGSLIRIPEKLTEKLLAIAERVNKAYKSGDPYAQAQAIKVKPFIQQALIMSGKYDAVVANPPYMGRGAMTKLLMEYSSSSYCDTKSDLFAMFLERAFELAKPASGRIAMVTMQSWMFLSSYETMRKKILENKTINNMAHLGPRAFGTISGEVVTVTAFSLMNKYFGEYKPTFLRLVDGDEQTKAMGLSTKINRFDMICQSAFSCIPCSPLAYWVTEQVHNIFSESEAIDDIGKPRRGLQTGNGPMFIRHWHEVDNCKTFSKKASKEECIRSSHKWYMFNNGGEFRKWHGSVDYVVNWENNGFEIKSTGKAIIPSESKYFLKSITWSRLSGGKTGFRLLREGILPGDTGPCIFLEGDEYESLLGFLNSTVAAFFLKIIVPNMTFLTGDIGRIPILKRGHEHIKNSQIIQECVTIGQEDWDSMETSWEFKKMPLLKYSSSLAVSYDAYHGNCKEMAAKMKKLEEENNRLFIEAYDLENELTPDVLEEQVTLFANPKYRYGTNLSEEDLEKRFKEDTIKELLSYSIGCMMGRYNLDELGLIYAHSGNEGFDSSRYTSFPADNDGIIPITDVDWFDDDAAERVFKFIETAWKKKDLDENLDFVADSLKRKSSESSRDAIRRFFCNDFFKDHLKRYKKRPIYWLFTSGKEKAFQCLVYLHRYNEGTLSRMRTEYVIPLQGRISSRIEMLTKDKEGETSTSVKTKIEKQISKLKKQAEELRQFDEKLRHYADMKIKLDLDDGVKVNYDKFGDLLAEVKAVTGKKN